MVVPWMLFRKRTWSGWTKSYLAQRCSVTADGVGGRYHGWSMNALPSTDKVCVDRNAAPQGRQSQVCPPGSKASLSMAMFKGLLVPGLAVTQRDSQSVPKNVIIATLPLPLPSPPQNRSKHPEHARTRKSSPKATNRSQKVEESSRSGWPGKLQKLEERATTFGQKL